MRRTTSRQLFLASIAAATVAASCRGAPSAPATPEAALGGLARAVASGDPGQVFDLLDQSSRWSVMTVHRDRRKICELVRSSYPRDRQARELSRCHPAETAREPRDYFISLARGASMLRPLQGLRGDLPLEGSGDQRQARGPQGLVLFCLEGAGWGYCGLREELDRLKVKAARDLATVDENAEAYRGR